MTQHAADAPRMEIDPDGLEAPQIYKIMAGCIVPRPIGFVTTRSRSGACNAAPFSFFNMVSHIPPLVCLSFSPIYRTGARKDTLTNILETGEFVVNIVGEDMATAIDLCSGSFPPEVDELQVCGLTPAASRLVAPPRVAESPASFECRLAQVVPLPESVYTMVVGRIRWINLRDGLLQQGGRIDMTALRAVGRMAGRTYARTSDIFALDHDTFEVVGEAGRQDAAGGPKARVG